MTSINLHATEAPATNPLNPQTVAGLVSLKTALGAKGPAQFVALAASLATLAAGIVAAINDRTAKSKKLAMNKVALSTASLQAPSVKPPDLSGAIQSTTHNLATINTPDTAKVQKGAAAASNVSDPSALRNFNAKQIDLIADRTRKETAGLVDTLKTVNGIRKAVQST